MFAPALGIAKDTFVEAKTSRRVFDAANIKRFKLIYTNLGIGSGKTFGAYICTLEYIYIFIFNKCLSMANIAIHNKHHIASVRQSKRMSRWRR